VGLRVGLDAVEKRKILHCRESKPVDEKDRKMDSRGRGMKMGNRSEDN
jgi:hypothetical protein